MDINKLLADIVGTMKAQDERIRALEAALEARIGMNNAQLEARISALEEAVEADGKAARQRAARRSGERRTRNGYRDVSAPATNIAVAAHMLFVLNIPAYRVAYSGVLTTSKVDGVKSWGPEYARQYAEENGVVHIYDNGLPLGELLQLAPAIEHMPEIVNRAAEKITTGELNKSGVVV